LASIRKKKSVKVSKKKSWQKSLGIKKVGKNFSRQKKLVTLPKFNHAKV